jgi:hypothetical protein
MWKQLFQELHFSNQQKKLIKTNQPETILQQTEMQTTQSTIQKINRKSMVLDKIVNDISNIGMKLGSNSDFFYISNNNDVQVISLLKSENDPL